MASFVAHYKKKQFQLQELEGELMALLYAGERGDVALKKAEEVRIAQIRAIREKIAKIVPSEQNAAAIGKLEVKINECNGMTAKAILEQYRRRVARMKVPPTITRAPRRGCW